MRPALLALCMLLGSAAVSSGGSGSAARTPEPLTSPMTAPVSRDAQRAADPVLRAVAGNGQVGLTETALADSLAVRATDAVDRPLAGVTVRFEVRAGGGSIIRAVVTDAAGIARAQWILGRARGRQSARATVGGSIVAFTATAHAPPSLELVIDTVQTIRRNAATYLGPVDARFRVKATGTVRVAMVFVDFSDAPASEPTDSVYQRFVPRSQAWYRTASYGQMTLDVTAIPGWYRMPRPAAAYRLHTVDTPEFHPYLAEVVATVDRDVDFSRFDAVYVVPTSTRAIPIGPAWSFPPGEGIRSDEGEVRFFVTLGAQSYNPNRRQAAVLDVAHETAHLLGLPDLYSGQPGRTLHDGFPFAGGWDIMSWLRPGADFFAWSKYKLGWLRPTQVKALGTGGLEAVLTPVELPGGLKMIALPLDASRAFVLELRQPVGLDTALCDKGVLLYTVDATVRSARGPLRVVPVTQGTDSTMITRCSVLYDATLDLRPGKRARYEDAALGVRVEVLSASAAGYRVRVKRW